MNAFEDHVCAICRRNATGFVYASGLGTKKPVAWVCDDAECLRLARDSYTALQRNFSRWESLAAQQGGKEAGEFLEKIGKTDLATLTIDEWCEFCRRLIAGYRSGLKLAAREEAPF